MIFRNIFITTLFLWHLSSNTADTKTIKYNVEYLKTLEKSTRDNFKNLQQTLAWCSGIPKLFQPVITTMGIIQEELDAIPLFKNVAKTTQAEFDAWINAQTNETVDALFKEADAQGSLQNLINMQNSKLHEGEEKFKKELTADGAFERLFQSSHFKSKHRTMKS